MSMTAHQCFIAIDALNELEEAASPATDHRSRVERLKRKASRNGRCE